METSVYTRPLQLQGESLGSSTPGAQGHIAGLHASVCGCSSDQAARSFVPSEFLLPSHPTPSLRVQPGRAPSRLALMPGANEPG